VATFELDGPLWNAEVSILGVSFPLRDLYKAHQWEPSCRGRAPPQTQFTMSSGLNLDLWVKRASSNLDGHSSLFRTKAELRVHTSMQRTMQILGGEQQQWVPIWIS
jgi:hypothetical protein